MHDYTIKNINRISTPALVVYQVVIESNISIALSIAANSILRPHIKTCKTSEVVQLMMNRGITQFKCATIAEAELLGMLKVKDVLLAYQPIGINLKRFKEIVCNYSQTKFHCLVDNVSLLNNIEELFTEHPISVFIDVNVGMNRTGVEISKVYEFVNSIRGLNYLNIEGLHVYDGHIEDKQFVERYHTAKQVLDNVKELKTKIEFLLGKQLKLIIGGTPTFPFYAATDEGLECSPGTFVFWDAGYDEFEDLPFLPAALLLTRVISIVNEQLLCLDLGHKAIASENSLHKRVRFLNQPTAVLISHSEEHLVVKVADTSKHLIGDIWYGIPWHICPTVALHQELQVVENGNVTKQWQVSARNRRINI